MTRDELPPEVNYEVSGCVMRASPPGAKIYCELIDGESRVRIQTSGGAHIAAITVHAPDDADLSEETRDVACALYWSWWRALPEDGTWEVEKQMTRDELIEELKKFPENVEVLICRNDEPKIKEIRFLKPFKGGRKAPVIVLY